MIGAAEISNAKARLTTELKGKGKRKRPAPVIQADAGEGDGDNEDDVVDTTKRQFTRSTRSKRGGEAQTLEVS